MNLEAEVCIVGAGPGGALLGYLLAKSGVSTIVLERHKGIDKEFRGEHLNKEGESLLKKYGLYEKVEKAGLLLMDRVEYCDRGHVIKSIFPSDGEEHVGIHVPQRNLLSVLMKESQAYENYRLMMGTKVTGLILDENGRVSGVHAHDGTKEITIKSSVVVGADGRFSTVRKLAELPYETIRHGYDLLWAKIPSPPGWEPTIKNALVGGRQLALFTQAGGWIQIGWNIEEDSYPHLKKQSFAPFIEKAIEAFPEIEEALLEHIQSWDDFILLKVHSCHCPAWVKDGLAIMGDAAHTMSPTGAFGINCALADASVLSEVIIEALHFHDVSESQLRKFENKRRADIEKLQRQQLEKEAAFRDHFEVFAMAH
ncbi:FAD-dependent monooxygenase [Mesobacillus foraminis]|uniref:2-polyprenyl-6-methoxyphenol hydroxylase-like FAD-dependent oxidoreductase n=1 Tax=Mesobacillus foraminis TaxID=279826 RepID=A0A4R2BJ16_9BACI|nr:FAD-dependent monooxygenase [Mesobacillus foraminis]TCN26593.1 2-polyprenyl-6-methoxyphenol hydroxylase-like FAD-dependent oxidoreductase [Mesobacillus foraminis]